MTEKGAKMMDAVDMTRKVFDVYKIVGDAEMQAFLPMIAMVVEEKCKADGYDAVDAFKTLYETSIKVQNILGKY